MDQLGKLPMSVVSAAKYGDREHTDLVKNVTMKTVSVIQLLKAWDEYRAEPYMQKAKVVWDVASRLRCQGSLSANECAALALKMQMVS